MKNLVKKKKTHTQIKINLAVSTKHFSLWVLSLEYRKLKGREEETAGRMYNYHKPVTSPKIAISNT